MLGISTRTYEFTFNTSNLLASERKITGKICLTLKTKHFYLFFLIEIKQLGKSIRKLP